MAATLCESGAETGLWDSLRLLRLGYSQHMSLCSNRDATKFGAALTVTAPLLTWRAVKEWHLLLPSWPSSRAGEQWWEQELAERPRVFASGTVGRLSDQSTKLWIRAAHRNYMKSIIYRGKHEAVRRNPGELPGIPRARANEHCHRNHLLLKLPAGGIVGIIGPNGAGKTTLFRMLTGAEEAGSPGEIRTGPSVKLAYVDQSRRRARRQEDGVPGNLGRPRHD